MGLLKSLPMLDHDVDILQQTDMPQDIAPDGYDVGVLSFADGADLIRHAHQHGGPVGCRANSDHGIDLEIVYPGVQFVPGGLTVKVHRDAAVRANQKDDA
jgi:hypothetical protein